ncbi:MAG: hypothetical protein WC781_01200 [Candidatus Pacearchaeota archaeon]|jgi:hypothetical protein
MTLETKIIEGIYEGVGKSSLFKDAKSRLSQGILRYNPNLINAILDSSEGEVSPEQRELLIYDTSENRLAEEFDKEIPKLSKKAEKDLATLVEPHYTNIAEDMMNFNPQALIELAGELPAYEVKGNDSHNKRVVAKKTLDKWRKIVNPENDKYDEKAYIESAKNKYVRNILAKIRGTERIKEYMKKRLQIEAQKYQFAFSDAVERDGKKGYSLNPEYFKSFVAENLSKYNEDEKTKAYSMIGEVYVGMIEKAKEEAKKSKK